MVEIRQMLAYEGTKPRPGHPMTPKYITIHNTANSSRGADADAHARLLRGSWKNKSISWHYVVDEKEIVQCIPDNENAWHAADGARGTGNRQSLAIEICENSDGDLRKATDNAVELTAMLMKKYNIPLSNVKQHRFWHVKDCPRRIRRGEPYDWATFLTKVDAFAGNNPEPPKPTPGDTYGNAGDKVVLNQVYFYASATTKTPTGGKRSGVYYLWSNEVIGGRIRITNSTANVGKTGKVTAWVNVSDIQANRPNPKPEPPKNDFLPPRGYFRRGDKSWKISKIASFMRKTFPSYTSAAALGPIFGKNLESSIKEFQKRTKLAPDGFIGPKTLAKMEDFGFKY